MGDPAMPGTGAGGPAPPASRLTGMIRPRSGAHDEDRARIARKPPRGRPRAAVDPRAAPYLLAAAFFAVYATYSLLRHRRMETHAYDLGLFEQVVRSYAHFEAPVSDIRGPGFNVLGEHFHPILALLGPVYRVFPGPETLLVAQALLIAVSVIPATRMAARVFGPLAGATIGFAYGLSWGIQSAVAFDFHEIAFAVPLLAFGLEHLLAERYRRALLWWLPLLLVKEDLGLLLAAAAVPLALRRRWGLAALHAGIGLAAFALTVFVLLPAVNPNDTYAFWGNLDGTVRAGNAEPGRSLSSVPFTELLLELPESMVLPSVKWMTLLTLLLPTGFLALRSPILAMAVPTLLWRFTSSNEFYWGTSFHYSAVLMPVVFAAFVDGVVRLRASRAGWLRRYAAKAAVVPVVAALVLARDFPLIDLLHLRTWRVPARVEAAHRVLGHIPDGARVSSTESLAPQLTSRTRVTEFPVRPPGVHYVVIELWDHYAEWGAYQVGRLREEGYEQVAAEKGVVLLKRR